MKLDRQLESDRNLRMSNIYVYIMRVLPSLPSFLGILGHKKKTRGCFPKNKFLLCAKNTSWGRTKNKKVIGCHNVA